MLCHCDEGYFDEYYNAYFAEEQALKALAEARQKIKENIEKSLQALENSMIDLSNHIEIVHADISNSKAVKTIKMTRRYNKMNSCWNNYKKAMRGKPEPDLVEKYHKLSQ